MEAGIDSKLTSKMRRLSVSALAASDGDAKKTKQRRHSKTQVKEKRKSASSVPLLSMQSHLLEAVSATNVLAPPSTERSPTSNSSSPKDVPHNVYTVYNEAGDLLSSFADDFDPATVDCCFQCGEQRRPLTSTVEFTSFQYPDVRIYRPVFSCTPCLVATAEKKRANPNHRVRIIESVIRHYAKAP